MGSAACSRLVTTGTICLEILKAPGRETIKMEREFYHRVGFAAKDDRPPQWVTKETLCSDLSHLLFNRHDL